MHDVHTLPLWELHSLSVNLFLMFEMVFDKCERSTSQVCKKEVCKKEFCIADFVTRGICQTENTYNKIKPILKLGTTLHWDEI